MSTISQRLYGPVIMTNSYATLWTATERTKITHIHITNINGSAVSVELYVNSSSGYILAATSIDGSATSENNLDSFFADLVLANGETIGGRANSASSLYITIMGKTGV